MWMDVRELSSYLKLKQKTIYHMVANGSIPHYRLSKLIRFKQSEIDAWLKNRLIKLCILSIILSEEDQAASKRRWFK